MDNEAKYDARAARMHRAKYTQQRRRDQARLTNIPPEGPEPNNPFIHTDTPACIFGKLIPVHTATNSNQRDLSTDRSVPQQGFQGFDSYPPSFRHPGDQHPDLTLNMHQQITDSYSQHLDSPEQQGSNVRKHRCTRCKSFKWGCDRVACDNYMKRRRGCRYKTVKYTPYKTSKKT